MDLSGKLLNKPMVVVTLADTSNNFLINIKFLLTRQGRQCCKTWIFKKFDYILTLSRALGLLSTGPEIYSVNNLIKIVIKKIESRIIKRSYTDCSTVLAVVCCSGANQGIIG